MNRLHTGIVVLLGAVLLSMCGPLLQAGELPGPLRVHPENPRYFVNPKGELVYLTGSHIWNNIQDWGTTDPPKPLDFDAYLDFLVQHGNNFTRLWYWENARWIHWSTKDMFIEPLPYARTGPGLALDGKPKFDLTKFNQAYFDRLRQRVRLAGERGIYCSVMLFQGCSIERKGMEGTPWKGHHFHRDNNINSIDGDPDGDEQGREVHTLAIPAITTLQDTYVRKVIDTLNDQNHILWEIANESHRDSTEWQYHMIRLIQSYEKDKPKQHLVWMTSQWEPSANKITNSGNNQKMYDSSAEVIALNTHGGYRTNPPPANGKKVSLLDTDHVWGLGGSPSWSWKSFTRGHQVVFMDPYFGIPYGDDVALWWVDDRKQMPALRSSLGDIRKYAEKMNLVKMTPQTKLASTEYCLAQKGHEYLVFQPNPGKSFTVQLTAGRYAYEWFDVDHERVSDKGEMDAQTESTTFKAPFDGLAVLYLKRVPGKHTGP